jgi:SAM-dependent methyltransferase
MSERLDWRVWHQDYDNPDSPVSHRLVEVRSRLTAELAARAGQVRLLSLCSGDARDTIPVVAASDRVVRATLVELEPALAARAAAAASEAGLEVDLRVGDAGDPATYADVLPVDVLLLVGVLGNVSDADARRTVRAAASMVAPGGVVIWSRSNRFRSEATHEFADPADWVRSLFEDAGFETAGYVVPEAEAWRLGVSRLRSPSTEPLPGHLFAFIR